MKYEAEGLQGTDSIRDTDGRKADLDPRDGSIQSKEEQHNTEIEYLYRDAGNYKTWNSVVVRGTFTKDEILLILDCCEDGDYYFIPEQIGCP